MKAACTMPSTGFRSHQITTQIGAKKMNTTATTHSQTLSSDGFRKRMRLYGSIICLLFAFALPAAAQTVGSALQWPKDQLFNNSGNPCNGCKLYVYQAGTSTPLNTYSDHTLSTPNANPIVLDSSGRFTAYVGTSAYKLRLDTSADVTLWTQDHIQTSGGAASAIAVSSISSDYTATLADNLLLVSGTRTITLPTAVGNTGKTYTIKNVSTGVVTIDGNGSQTIDGAAQAYAAAQLDWLSIASNGTNWTIIGAGWGGLLSVQRGDVSVGVTGNTWDNLAIGTASRYLRSDGTDVAWSWPAVICCGGGTFAAQNAWEFMAISTTSTVQLPSCVGGTLGKWYHIKNIGAAATITIDPDGAQTIDGAATYVFSIQYSSISIVCDGSGAWYIF